ncbi:MAG TPA: hypothetical protein VKK61_09920, partial [Tepidisphaeraceae bacterium]|nr:hypothetical protein [Tepidisphaeraceae bacterium]
MKKLSFGVVVFIGLLAMQMRAADLAPTSAPANRMNYRERYSVLAEHDIFLRDRSHHVSRPTSRPAFATPEQAFVLTGIVFEDGEFHAYLEDLARSTSMILRVGDAVARGQIADIQMDAVEYQGPGGATWIEIGNNLSGGEVESVSAARIAAAAS